MRLRPILRSVPSSDVCIFCALRSSFGPQTPRVRTRPQVRSYDSTAPLRQAAQAVAAEVDEEREEDNDYYIPPMLQQNAAVQRGTNFPERYTPPAASLASYPRRQAGRRSWRERPDVSGIRRDQDSDFRFVRQVDPTAAFANRNGHSDGRHRPSWGNQSRVFDARTEPQDMKSNIGVADNPSNNLSYTRPASNDYGAGSQSGNNPPVILYQPFSGRFSAKSSLSEESRTDGYATAAVGDPSSDKDVRQIVRLGSGVRRFVPNPTAPLDKLDQDQRSTTRAMSQGHESTEALGTVNTLPAASSPEFSAYSQGTRRSHARSARFEKMSSRFDIGVAEQNFDESFGSIRKNKAKSGRQNLPKTADDYNGPDEDDIVGNGMGKKSKRRAKVAHVDLPSKPRIQLPEFVSVEKLAQSLKVRVDDLVRKLEEEGFEGARYDHILDAETSAVFADIYGFEPLFGASSVQDLVARSASEDKSALPPRPPIVTIMGHVDHGKTTILDWLRKSSVVESEHGGITQHIGAFQFQMPGSDRQITFLDTPGHAAFLDMRRRGALVTDIVVLVVAADDGVKPQTLEAIKHALEAQVQIIVAINKVDKPDANIERVKQDLAQHEISVEDYGGEYQAIAVSGKTGQGMQDLEEAILTLSDVSDFRAEADGQAEGWVIESKVTMAGRVATVLVRRGTLRPGDIIVAGTTWARVRTLKNDSGHVVTEAPPGTPVQIDGWRGDPTAGLEVLQAESEDQAKNVVEMRLQKEESMETAADTIAINAARSADAEARARVLEKEAEDRAAFLGSRNSKRYWSRPTDNEGFLESMAEGPRKVDFVIKADVAGSVEAVTAVVKAVGNDEISANIVHHATGQITESDIRRLAATGEKGYVINFNQVIDPQMVRLADIAGLLILDHNIIYKVTDDVKERLAEALPPIKSQRVLGEAEIGQIFEVTTKKGKHKVAGCKVTNGTVNRAHKMRVQRAGETVYEGGLESLKNVKKDVTEMRKGTECGMAFANWATFEVGDKVQCFEETEEKRILY